MGTASAREDGRHAPGSAGFAVFAACAAVLAAASAAGQAPTRPPAPARSPPPGGTWDRVTAGTFLPDAFSTLTGERPSFEAAAPGSQANRAPSSAPIDPAGGGFAWSTLVSEDSLTDEIIDAKSALATACATLTEFKGGGFEQAQVSFGTLAMAFGVIAAYDGDVRWKKDAAAARDLFARAGFNCKVGTDQTFAESRARLEDLGLLLEGSGPRDGPERDEDFRWSQVAGRPALMKRLEAAQDGMRPAIASPAAFRERLEELRHAVEIVAVIGELIRQPDFEDHDDDDYRGHAATMRDAAGAVREACGRKDYQAARDAVGAIEKSCDACHEAFRG